MGILDLFFGKDIKAYEKENNKLKKQIKAMTEGTRTDDILTTSVTGISTVTPTQKKNMYKTYSSTIRAIYDMYNNAKDFGGEFIKSVIRTRVAFIAGGGVTVISENQKTAEWITEFLKYNKFQEGSNLFKAVTNTEMEGKVLLVLKVNKKTQKIDIRIFSYINSPYTVTMDEKDDQIIKSVTYKSEDENKQQEVAKIERLVYIRTGGSPDKINETTPVIGNCLTDIENASRIKYDLRYNNHLYGRLTPCFKTKDMTEAKALNNLITRTNWEIGRNYVGTAELTLVGPPPEATEVLTNELKTSNRIISLNTGIPVHWLSWPDLMSNRSTAETLSEVINAATIMEREIWEEGLTELVIKAMNVATELGLEGAVNDPDGFEIRLPYISESKMKEIQETWIPLSDGGFITQDSVRNKIPGIDPIFEKRMLEAEKEAQVQKIKNKFGNEFDAHNHEQEEMNEEVEE